MNKSPDDKIVQSILQALQNTACRILVYGNNGNGTTEIAVITPYRINVDQEARLSDAVAEFNKKHDAKYSVIDIDTFTFEKKRKEIPLYQEIDQSGVELWPSAPAEPQW